MMDFKQLTITALFLFALFGCADKQTPYTNSEINLTHADSVIIVRVLNKEIQYQTNLWVSKIILHGDTVNGKKHGDTAMAYIETLTKFQIK